MKKRLVSIAVLFTTALLLMGCSDDNQGENSNKTDSSSGDLSAAQSEKDNDIKENKQTDKKEDDSESEESDTDDSGKSPSQEDSENTNGQSESKESEGLSAYSTEEIEYARVWLQIVGNKDTEELNVRHISVGEQVNPYDDDSVNYPEDVIALGGKSMADGVVTYSGNGDGTINLYNVPSHWPSYKQIDESMEEYTGDIIENTEEFYIDPGDDEEIIKLIEKINVQS